MEKKVEYKKNILISYLLFRNKNKQTRTKNIRKEKQPLEDLLELIQLGGFYKQWKYLFQVNMKNINWFYPKCKP